MIGKHHVYVLARQDKLCLKLGYSSSLADRVRALNRAYGPFSGDLSWSLRADDRQEAEGLEAVFKKLFEDYHIEIPGPVASDGESEWYAFDCYEDILACLSDTGHRKHGEGYHLQRIPVEDFAPLSAKIVKKLEIFAKSLRKQTRQVDARSENVANKRAFRAAMKQVLRHLIGLSRTDNHTLRDTAFEIYFRANSCSREQLDTLFRSGSLTAENNSFSAGANLCTNIEWGPEFQRVTVRIPRDDDLFEQSWESRGFLAKFESFLQDLSRAYPLPPGYRQFVGTSFLDRLSPEHRSQVHEEFRKALLFGLW